MKIKSRNSLNKILSHAFFWLTMLLLPVSAISAEIEASFDIGVGYSNNIGRATDTAPTLDENIGVAGVRFGLVQDTRKLEATIRSDFQYLYYADDSFDNEVIGGLDAYIDYSFVEDRFSWIIRDNYGQQLLDPFLPERPDTRENINYFSTGPTFTFPMGDRHSLELDVQYSNVKYETSALSNDGGSAAIQLGRAVSEDRILSINAFIDRTEYDNDGLSQEFDRSEVFARLEGTSGRNIFSIDLGYTELDFQTQTADGPLARVDWTRTISPSSTFTVSAGSNFSDQSETLRYIQSNQREIGGTADIDGQDAPFRHNRLALRYSMDHDRTDIDLGIEWTDEDYEGRSDRDRTLTRAIVLVRRDLTKRVFGELHYEFFNREYSELTREDDDTSLILRVGYRLTRTLSVSLEYLYFNRDSNLNTGEYTEHRGFLRISYEPLWGS